MSLSTFSVPSWLADSALAVALGIITLLLAFGAQGV